jgi:hypothetical protein
MKSRKKAPQPAKPQHEMCSSCQRYLALVRVEGLALCWRCHEGWLAARGLGSQSRPDNISSPPLEGWRPR